MTKVLKKHDLPIQNGTRLKEVEILSMISKAKALGITAATAVKESLQRTTSNTEKSRKYFTSSLAAIYKDYQEALQLNNCLDFDDLLLFGMKLFSRRNRVKWCKHVLVDELCVHPLDAHLWILTAFSSQDSNSIQYEWAKHLAAVHRGITIVGDPDQSSALFTVAITRMANEQALSGLQYTAGALLRQRILTRCSKVHHSSMITMHQK